MQVTQRTHYARVNCSRRSTTRATRRPFRRKRRLRKGYPMNLSKIKKEFFTLDSKVEFYLPTMTVEHKPISKEALDEARSRVASTLSNAFGGCTATSAVGYYENKVRPDRYIVLQSNVEDIQGR